MSASDLLGGDGGGFLSSGSSSLRSSLSGSSLSGGSLNGGSSLNGSGSFLNGGSGLRFSTDLNGSGWGSFSYGNGGNGESPESIRTGTVGSRGRVNGSRLVNNWGWSVNNRGRGGGWGVDNWSWGWGVNWSWGVCWGWGICWGGCLVGGFLGEVSLSLIFDISGVTTLISVVGDNLDTAVGKVDTVFSGGVVVVTVLVVGERLSGEVIADAVVEVVVGREDGVGNKGRWAIAWGRGSVDLGHA